MAATRCIRICSIWKWKPAFYNKQTRPCSTIRATDGAVHNSFIPMSTRDLSRFVLEDDKMLDAESRSRFEQLSSLLQYAIDKDLRISFDEIKTRFECINPDLEIPRSAGKPDDEFWVIHKLASVLHLANFQELSHTAALKHLQEYKKSEGVMVGVNVSEYDILQFWVLGTYKRTVKRSYSQQLLSELKKMMPVDSKLSELINVTPTEVKYHKRLVIASRKKGDEKLSLKMFKDIPQGGLEQVVPGAVIRMPRLDRISLLVAAGTAVSSLITKIITQFHNAESNFLFVVIGLTGSAAFQIHGKYNDKKMKYLNSLNKTLYYKLIANNRGLISTVVDRARDEVFKECLLVYGILSNSRGLSPEEINMKINKWVLEKSNNVISFDSLDALLFLSEEGIARVDRKGVYSVLPVDQSLILLSARSGNVDTGADVDIL